MAIAGSHGTKGTVKLMFWRAVGWRDKATRLTNSASPMTTEVAMSLGPVVMNWRPIARLEQSAVTIRLSLKSQEKKF